MERGDGERGRGGSLREGGKIAGWGKSGMGGRG